jgi:sugar/nucleoside kinase (ribokinase family)
VLERAGVSLEHTLFDEGWSTPLYGKVVLTNGDLAQEDPRIDFVNTAPLPEEAAAALRASVETAVRDLDAVVVADYQANGVLDAESREALNELARARPETTWVADSRAQIGAFQGMTLKPNEIEAARLFFSDRPFENVSEAELKAAALALAVQTGRPLVITRGERGCWVFDGEEATPVPAVEIPPPIDPVGAGDTFVACLACCLAVGASPWEAASIATLAAAVTVRMLNITGTASPGAILAQYDAL